MNRPTDDQGRRRLARGTALSASKGRSLAAQLPGSEQREATGSMPAAKGFQAWEGRRPQGLTQRCPWRSADKSRPFREQNWTGQLRWPETSPNGRNSRLSPRCPTGGCAGLGISPSSFSSKREQARPYPFPVFAVSRAVNIITNFHTLTDQEKHTRPEAGGIQSEKRVWN